MKCGHEFEVVEPLSEHERVPRPPCPKCKSKEVEQVPAAFSVVTSRKA
jgi:putative FmdB family regulatory protein